MFWASSYQWATGPIALELDSWVLLNYLSSSPTPQLHLTSIQKTQFLFHTHSPFLIFDFAHSISESVYSVDQVQMTNWSTHVRTWSTLPWKGWHCPHWQRRGSRWVEATLYLLWKSHTLIDWLWLHVRIHDLNYCGFSADHPQSRLVWITLEDQLEQSI